MVIQSHQIRTLFNISALPIYSEFEERNEGVFVKLNGRQNHNCYAVYFKKFIWTRVIITIFDIYGTSK